MVNWNKHRLVTALFKLHAILSTTVYLYKVFKLKMLVLSHLNSRVYLFWASKSVIN